MEAAPGHGRGKWSPAFRLTGALKARLPLDGDVPVVTLDRPDLCKLIGEDIPMETLTTRMPMIGGDLDGVDGESIIIEWFPDRPDLLTPEGTARAVAAFFGIREGLPSYTVSEGGDVLHVDESVATVRPYAALCRVRGVPFNEALVKSVVDAQEKLTLAPGRRRRKIAIGIHDAKDIQGPFTYTTIGRDEKPFVPLAETEAKTPGEILETHPKGREYGHLVGARVPVFLDGNGEVLSMPPVINAARTAVTAETRDILIDVTGTDAASVRRTVALLASGFADRGGSIESCVVHDASGTWTCPDLRAHEHVVQTEDVQQALGVRLDADAIAGALRRMGHDAQAFDTQVLAQVPAWRFDILHPVDLIEDVAIGHGYENFPGELPTQSTIASALPIQGLEDRARALLVGHGMHEVRTLTLSNPADQWTHWGEAAGDAVKVANPVLEEQTHLRVKLAPSLLRVLAANRHRSLPQRIFEAGYVVKPGLDGYGNRMHLAVVEQDARTGFSDIKGLAEALQRDLGIDVALAAADVPGFIAGRAGTIHLGEQIIGSFGELHPDTIVAFGLAAATTVLEMDLEACL